MAPDWAFALLWAEDHQHFMPCLLVPLLPRHCFLLLTEIEFTQKCCLIMFKIMTTLDKQLGVGMFISEHVF